MCMVGCTTIRESALSQQWIYENCSAFVSVSEPLKPSLIYLMPDLFLPALLCAQILSQLKNTVTLVITEVVTCQIYIKTNK